MKKIHLLTGFLIISSSLAAQNIGIGTLIPAGKLHIRGTDDTTQLVIDANSAQSNSKPLIKLRNSNGIELMRIHSDDTSNLFIGRNAGIVNDAFNGENFNTFIGSNAGYSNTTGSRNTANGNSALYSNTIGSENTANGIFALSSNINGFRNAAIGTYSLSNNTAGNQNTATGAFALWKNTTANYNTAYGAQTLLYNTTGDQNTAIGSDALLNNSTGNKNTAIGYQALYNNNGGNNNIAIGANSGTYMTMPDATNTIGIGNYSILINNSNYAFFGNLSTAYNGGNQTWSSFSDARMKRNIKEEVKGLDFILRLRPVTYFRDIEAAMKITGNKDSRDFPEKYDVEKIKESGFLAQEVEQAAKDAGYVFSGVGIPKKSNDLYTLSYEQFVVPLVKAMQEQQAIIEEQNKKFEQQQLQINTLLKEIQLLKNKQQ